MSHKKRIATLSALLGITSVLFAEAKTIEEILKEYNPSNLTRIQSMEIMEALKEAGYAPGPDLDKLIDDNGFNSSKLRELNPPPQKREEGKMKPQGKAKGKKNSGKIYSALELNFKKSDFNITSSAVVNGELLDEFKGEKKVNGVEKSIPLKWANVPEGTTSLAVIMYHYPNPNDKTGINSYLLLWNIDPIVTEIDHGEADDGEWFMGANKDGNIISYTSPNSPSAGEHTYTISIFALSQPLKNLPAESSLDVDFDMFMSAIESNKIIGKADLVFKDINR